MGHFGVRKTLDVLHEHLFQPKMKRDVERACARCITYRQAKSRVLPHGLYTPLPIPSAPWVIFLRILFQACLCQEKVGIQFLWLLIGFLRWHISYLVIKLMMQPTLLICSLERQYCSMVFLGVLCLIVMLSSLTIFGKSCGESWELSYCF